MIGHMLKMTTATMVLMVIIVSLSIRRAEAIGKETPEEYYRGYHDRPLRNKQLYSYPEHHAGYFPRPRHGYSKPRPKPRETPCSCKKTFFVPVAELKTFEEHWIAASLMGCTLATGSGKDELREIRQVAIDYQPVQPNIPRLPFMWIGVASEPVHGTLNFDVGGDFGWLDGCTPYTEDVFVRPTNARDQSTFDSVFPDFFIDANESSDVGEHDGDVVFGIINYETESMAGVIFSVPLSLFNDVSFPSQLPAIYECCVGNKSYRPQTYVLGSHHETKKKILHAQSPYIP